MGNMIYDQPLEQQQEHYVALCRFWRDVVRDFPTGHNKSQLSRYEDLLRRVEKKMKMQEEEVLAQ